MRPSYTKKYIEHETSFCKKEINAFYACKLINNSPQKMQLRNALLVKRLKFKEEYGDQYA